MHLFQDRYASGLFGRRCGKNSHDMKSVALRGVDVQANVVDMCAEVQVSQRYCNNERYAIEAQYLFPIDNRAAVTGFESDIDGVVTKAVIKEKVQARQAYDAAVARGDGAQLLEQKRDDIFQMSIGNLSPGSTCVIRIKYVTDLKAEGNASVFFLPTHVAPRYTPALERDPLPGARGPRWVEEGLRVHIVAAMATNITAVKYETGGIPMTITGDNNVRKVVLGDGMQYLTQDIVVKISTESPHQPRCMVEKCVDSNTHCAVVTLAPHLDFDDCKCELVFVVDRSGSMSGDKIAQASMAMQLFVRSLPEDCYFNIVGFGSRNEFLWPESVQYGEESLAKASRHVANMRADLGGTEILDPMRRVLSGRPIPGYTRQVFLLTDGQVSNTESVIHMVRQYTDRARTFALGLGSGASHALVEGVARAGNGTSAFVLRDGLESKVIQQLKHALQPALTEVSIEWEGAMGAPPVYTSVASSSTPDAPPAAEESAPKSVFGAFAAGAVGSLLNFSARTVPPPNPALSEGFARAPFNTPPIFSGERFLSYCLVEQGGVAPQAVHITAKTPAGNLDVRLEVRPQDIVQGTAVHAMAARALVQDLEDGRSWLGPLDRTGDKTKAEIIRLGLKYGLTTKHTSYVAVQEGRDIEQLLMRSQQSDMMYSLSAQSMQMSNCSARSVKSKKKSGGGMLSMLGGSIFGSSGRGGGGGRSWGRSGAARPSSSAAPPPPGISGSTRCVTVGCISAAPPPAPSASAPRRCFAMENTMDADSDDDDEAEEVCCSDNDYDAVLEKCSAAPFCATESDCLSEPPSTGKPSRSRKKVAAKEAKCTMNDSLRPRPSDTARLQAVVALQDFSGCFLLNQSLVDVTGVSMAVMTTKAEQVAAACGVSSDTAARMVATSVAIAFLRSALKALQSEWELIDTKATRWLNKQSRAQDDYVQTVGLPLVLAC
eukprot:m.490577 g.490577  ORF g.490577 m.490577 type:complete len:941 (-) comp21779_c0_seq1:160-2982(-)